MIVGCSGQRARVAELHGAGGGPAPAGGPGGGGLAEPASGGDRATSAHQAAEARAALDAALAELNQPSNTPDGCDAVVWDRLCRNRRDKIQKELLVSTLL